MIEVWGPDRKMEIVLLQKSYRILLFDAFYCYTFWCIFNQNEKWYVEFLIKRIKENLQSVFTSQYKKQRQNPITSVWDVEVGGLNLSHSSYCWSLCITDHIKEYVEGSY